MRPAGSKRKDGGHESRDESASRTRHSISKGLVYLFLRAVSWCGNRLSAETVDGAAKRIGRVMFYLLPGRRRVAMQNLTLAFGDTMSKKEKTRIAKRAFEHISISFMEMFRISRILKEDLENTFSVQGLEHIENALARKKGMIFVVSHLGSWEYLSFLFYITGLRCSVLVKKLRNFYIFEWLNTLRRQTTMRIIHKDDARHALKTILRELSKNNVVAILMDQWAGNEEAWVDFFGKPASTTSIPARLALKTGCALVPGTCIRKGPGKYEIRILPEVPADPGTDDRLSVTRRLNQLLEEQIRIHPEQWTWTHKRWKGKKKYPTLEAIKFP